MKMTVENWGDQDTYESVEDYAVSALSGDDYDRGVMEAAARRAENNSAAIGRLLESLVQNNVLSIDDLPGVLGKSYHRVVSATEKL